MNPAFQEALDESARLFDRLAGGEADEKEGRNAVRDLLVSREMARGFFVSLLAGEWQFADQPEPWLIEILRERGDVVAEILVKNVVMSAATAVQHEREGRSEFAERSRRVTQRSGNLITLINSDQIRHESQRMLAAIERNRWSSSQSMETDQLDDFLKRWQYDNEQLLHAAEAVRPYT